MNDVPELIGLPYSPWSERARWALDSNGISYRRRTYQPLLGEPGLRLRLRRWSGNITVPVLALPGGGCVADSNDIARWADREGRGALATGDERLGVWLQRAEDGLIAGRALALRRMLADPEALASMVPGWLRRLLGPLSTSLGGFGIRRTLRKYGAPDDITAGAALDATLDALRSALGADPGATVLGTFSYADIAMAQVLVFVEPPAMGPMRFSDGSRRTFRDAERAERYADLLAWRDTLYQRHREPGTPPQA